MHDSYFMSKHILEGSGVEHNRVIGNNEVQYNNDIVNLYHGFIFTKHVLF